MSVFFEGESTQRVLLAYIAETERIFTNLLRSFDNDASCRIIPNLDLGFPHDVVRIAGGFPTGILVSWSCKIPLVPVDTTVNVCTSSVFELSDDISDGIQEDNFAALSEKLSRSSYRQNFQRGNHFISIARSRNDGRPFLILHSSAAEFKKDYNGLYPVPGNWYTDKIAVHVEGARYLRYIVGRPAEIFSQIASHIRPFNESRHDFVAEVVVDGMCKIERADHRHHYYMPNDQSIMIGGFVAQCDEVLPIFTMPGFPIFLYRVEGGGENNRVEMPDLQGFLAPHGWGKRSKVEPLMHVDYKQSLFLLNGLSFAIDVSASLRDHPDLELRAHEVNGGPNDYFSSIQRYCPGTIMDCLEQVASFSKLGFVRWLG